MAEKSKTRDQFSSKIGVIAAAAGSAVGLGNIWKFPYEAGKGGGGAFIFIYLGCILLIGLPVMISEFVIGRKGKANAVRSFKNLAPNTPWYFNGIMGVAASFMILSFYGVVAGWTLEYIVLATGNKFHGMNSAEITNLFDSFLASPGRPLIFQVLFMIFTAAVVLGGIKNGIERITKILMPILVIIIVVIGIRSITLGTNVNEAGEIIGKASDGLKFLFRPDFSKVTGKVIVNALGHAFFSLSLGMGTIITYGSYIKKDTNINRTALQVTFLDTLIALLAGIAIFPAVFYFGVEPTEGAGLAFMVLPGVFEEMAGGQFWTIIFFLLLSLAALTSSISLLEVAVAYFAEELKMNRTKATIFTTAVITLLGVACSLSFNVFSGFTIFGKDIFNITEYLSSNILLPLGGLFIALFVGWQYKKEDFKQELSNNGEIKLKFFNLFFFIIKIVAPIAIAIVFLASSRILKL